MCFDPASPNLFLDSGLSIPSVDGAFRCPDAKDRKRKCNRERKSANSSPRDRQVSRSHLLEGSVRRNEGPRVLSSSRPHVKRACPSQHASCKQRNEHTPVGARNDHSERRRSIG